jgi:hypothetical protein
MSLFLAAAIACLCVPSASADLGDAVHAPPSPVDGDVPLEGAVVDHVEALEDLVDAALEHVLRGFATNPPAIDAKYADAGLECQLGTDLQRQTSYAGPPQGECEGYVCTSDEGEGPLPVSFGREGMPGVGVAMQRNEDGSYGPYLGVYVNSDGHCRCLAWIQVA